MKIFVIPGLTRNPSRRESRLGGRDDNATTALTPACPAGRPTLSHYWERGTTSTYYFASIFVIVFLALGFLFYNHPCTNFHEAILQTPTQKISLALADTPEQQTRGLGGCTYVPKNAGMYFPFNPSQNATFWMKDMLIPIDIIWIKNGVVTGIKKNVPNEPKNTPDSALKIYPSPNEVDAVLEVEEGKANEYGIVEGSRVNLT